VVGSYAAPDAPPLGCLRKHVLLGDIPHAAVVRRGGKAAVRAVALWTGGRTRSAAPRIERRLHQASRHAAAQNDLHGSRRRLPLSSARARDLHALIPALRVAHVELDDLDRVAE